MAGDFQHRSLGTIRPQALKPTELLSCPLHTKINMRLKQQGYQCKDSDMFLDYLILPQNRFHA